MTFEDNDLIWLISNGQPTPLATNQLPIQKFGPFVLQGAKWIFCRSFFLRHRDEQAF